MVVKEGSISRTKSPPKTLHVGLQYRCSNISLSGITCRDIKNKMGDPMMI